MWKWHYATPTPERRSAEYRIVGEKTSSYTSAEACSIVLLLPALLLRSQSLSDASSLAHDPVFSLQEPVESSFPGGWNPTMKCLSRACFPPAGLGPHCPSQGRSACFLSGTISSSWSTCHLQLGLPGGGADRLVYCLYFPLCFQREISPLTSQSCVKFFVSAGVVMIS